MKVGIIGGGAIGLLYAFHLTKAFSVTLYVKREEQLQRITENKGISALQHEKKETRNVLVKRWNDADAPQDDVIIIAVKQYNLPELTPVLQVCTSGQSILFLQNGMSHLELLDRLSTPRLYVGVVEHGVKKENEYTITWTGKGRTKIASYPTPQTKPEPVDFIEDLQKCMEDEFPIEVCADYYQMMLEKLLVNAIINPLTAIYHVRNGELLTNSHYKKTMSLLYEELSFLVEQGKREGMWKHICSICERTATNWSSMERDIREGRETEVDAILGYIKKMANSKGKSVPVTEFIYEAVKGLEDTK